MSPPAGPSNGEVMRRLDELVIELRRVTDTLQEAYVRKDVLQAVNNAIGIQITGLEDEQHVIHKRIDKMQNDAATNRKLIVSSFVAPIVVGLVVVLILSAIGVHK